MENNNPLQPPNPNQVAGKPLYSTTDANGNTLDTLQATNAIPEVEKYDIKKSIDEFHTDKPIQNLRTFQSDITDAMKKKQEEEAAKIAPINKQTVLNAGPMDDPERSLFVLMLSGILIVAGVAALTVFYVYKTRKAPIVVPKIEAGKLISTETTKDITLTPNQSLQEVLIATRDSADIAPNALQRLQFSIQSATSTKSKFALTGQDLATQLKTQMPTWLIRAFTPDNVIGLHSIGEKPQPFIIFKTDSYENAFAGMVKWEETMKADLPAFISSVPRIDTGTTTSSSTLLVAVTSDKFQDGIIQNKDVRILKNSLGQTVLIYSIADKETVVITTNETTLRELFSRLVTSQFVQ